MSGKVDYEYSVSLSAPQIAMRVWSTASSISVDPASIATMQDECNRLSVDYWSAVYKTLTPHQADNFVFVLSRVLSASDFRQIMARGAKVEARREVEAELAARFATLAEREERANRALDVMDRAIQAQSRAITASNDAYASNSRLLARVEELEAENAELEARFGPLRDKLAALLDSII